MAMQVNETAPPKHPHLNYLDGIRGFSAIYVVMYHIYHELTNYQNLHIGPSRLIFLFQKLFGWGGHDCVTIFICLSGFSLAIPLAKARYRNLSNSNQFKNFMIRRALRIAPPYYVSILLIVIAALLFPGLSIPTQTSWNNALPILDARSILYHVTFLHALDPNQIFKISPQFWSIGTEAQLYFWLPLILVPIACRKSILWGVAASLVACLIIIPIKSVESACLHYVFTFSLGALAADLIFNQSKRDKPNDRLAMAVLIIFLAGCLVVAQSTNNIWAFRDMIISPVIAIGLYFLARDLNPGPAIKRIRHILSSRIMMFLGKISYSLYLVHYVYSAFCTLSLYQMV